MVWLQVRLQGYGDGRDTGAPSALSAPFIPLRCGGGTSGDRGGPIFEPPGFEVSRAFKVLPILQTGAEGLG